ncbi:HLH-domain-containing protein [Neoconidiobolus thromboides FSU 785]|nr:HLH-domain-containing protein [Neoconidiobolus thromboides FSU 785]
MLNPDPIKPDHSSETMMMNQEEMLQQGNLYELMALQQAYDPMFPVTNEMMMLNDPTTLNYLAMNSNLANLANFSEPFNTEFYEYKGKEEKSKENKRRVKIEEEDEEQSKLDSAELRRKIHIQSEQKRRAQIKDGFEELRKQLPNCANKQLSKAAILNKTCLHVQQLKASQFVLLTEIDRLRLENDHLRQLNQALYPKHAVNNLYSLNL